MNKMTIQISSGIGSGVTKLAAFDAALFDAGIANFNLIKLSSVIPPNSTIKVVSNVKNGSGVEFGNKLYVVISEKRESENGREAWAGLGWAQSNTGNGLFVEQCGSQEAEVKRLIKETLESMIKYREEKFGPINYNVVGIQCINEPVCALSAAVYKSEGWK